MKRFVLSSVLACLMPLLQAQTRASYLVGLPDTQLYPQYWNQDGKIDGYLPRILRRFSADTGMNLELKAQPIRRYYLEFSEGRLDFVAPSNPAWAEGKSAQTIIYSDPFMTSRAGFIGTTPQFDPAHIKHITTLAGYTISFLSDSKSLFKKAKVNYVNNVNSAMLVLASKRTDLVYLHYDAAREWLRLNASTRGEDKPQSKDKFYFHEAYSEQFEYCLATIRHPQIIKNFNTWLRRHPTTLQEIKASLASESRYP